MTGVFAAVALLTLPSGAISGRVTGPDGRGISDALFTARCAASTVSGRTNDDGWFVIEAPGGTRCSFRIEASGFTPWSGRLDRYRTNRIELRLSPRSESVEVRARALGVARVAQGAATGATLDRTVLEAAGPDTNRWATLAEHAAGRPLGQRVASLNGLAATGLPEANAIQQVGAFVDPFGVESNGVDRYSLNVTMGSPQRSWRVGLAPGLLSTDRSDPLLEASRSRLRNRSLSFSGPVPGLVQVQVQGMFSSNASSGRPVYLETQTGVERLAADVDTSNGLDAWLIGASAQTGRLALDVTVLGSRAESTNGGVGGRQGPSSALALDSDNWRAQASWQLRKDGWTHRGGFSFDHISLDTASASTGLGIVQAGRLLGGAPDVIRSQRAGEDWSVRATFHQTAALPAWLVGVEAGARRASEQRVFNPAGQLLLEDPSAERGTWFLRPGRAQQRANEEFVALYGQGTLIATETLWLRVGVRADLQFRHGLLLSPRVSLGRTLGSWLLGANAGLFTDRWGVDDELEGILRSGAPTLEVAPRPAGADPQPYSSSLRGGTPLLTLVSGERRRAAHARLSLVRAVGSATVALEETVTLGSHLAGMRRHREGEALVDQLEGGRFLHRAQTHLRLDAPLRGWTATAHYEHAHSVDDTDGPFSLPELQTGSKRERGPSTGVPTHALTILAHGPIRAGIRAILALRLATGTPYSLLTGGDPEGLFTFTERTETRRNHRRLPATRDVALYASRSFPRVLSGVGLDTGVRLENLLGVLVPLDVERSAQSLFAGRPVSAASGRTLSVWATVSWTSRSQR